MRCSIRLQCLCLLLAFCFAVTSRAQEPLVRFDAGFPIVNNGHATAIYIAPDNPETVRVAAGAFAADVERVSHIRPQILASLDGAKLDDVILLGVLGHSPEIDALQSSGKLDTKAVAGKWESAITAVVAHPAPGIGRALVIAGSDRRGAAFALFTLSRQMGVSPWTWWADVPAAHHDQVFVGGEPAIQHEPSVQYRGIFLNDEDWGLRPWAAGKMDPALKNIGPRTYERIFELLLRLHANALWPAMHPGTLAFNAVPENAILADRWGIVMGSSHSEALLRNNVGEWDEKRDGPWNYQLNRPAIDAYWDKRLAANERYENFYTVGMRGVHDTGLEATGTAQVKAKLVEDVMHAQRDLLAKHAAPGIAPDLAKIPQVIWLYKESLELYRAGMQVPDDVTLGWTDDNYGYLRQLPNAAEQKRSGGSGIYYHVSYWGFPHDYLWLCTTPPSLIREEMTKAFDHGARRYWVLNVGDLKPAESDIDYFMQLAEDEPRMAKVDQLAFLQTWFAEQFPAEIAPALATVMDRYYQLNFVRKPEFMGFNGYDDGINRTDFNPLAWNDQNQARAAAFTNLRIDEQALAQGIPAAYRDAFFELIQYPIEASAAQNFKFLAADRGFLDEAQGNTALAPMDAQQSAAAYAEIQSLTARYNNLAGGKWRGIMSSAPRNREVFKMPRTATAADARTPLPASWSAGNPAVQVISFNPARFSRKSGDWHVLDDLGITGASVVLGAPGAVESDTSADAPWLDYDFRAVAASGKAKLTIYLLPTFPVDSAHRLRYAVSLDNGKPIELDASGSGEWHENSAPVWARNVLRNAATEEVDLGKLAFGPHTIRLIYRDPAVVFEHLVVAFDGAPPAYPVPPETR